MSLTDAWNELTDWLMTISPEFAFLIAIPFAVAAAGLAKHWIDRSGDAPRDATSGRKPGARSQLPFTSG